MPASKPKGILQDQLLEAHEVSYWADAAWRGGSCCIASGGYALLCRDRLSRTGPEGWPVSTPGVSCLDDKVSPLQKAEIVKIVRSHSYRTLNSQNSESVPSNLSLFSAPIIPSTISSLNFGSYSALLTASFSEPSPMHLKATKREVWRNGGPVMLSPRREPGGLPSKSKRLRANASFQFAYMQALN